MRSILLTSVVMVIFLTGCDKSEPPPEPVIRPVVTYVVPNVNGEIQRSFAGVVDSVRGTGISFEVGGRVVEVLAKEGQRYQAGEVLARLDAREFMNQLNGANAQLVEARQALRRSQQLLETGNAAQSQLESSIARERSAQSGYNSTRKMVEDSVLKMPYTGVIGSKTVEPGMVIAAGQTVMTIQGEGVKEFEIGAPAEVIGSFLTGMKGTIKLGSLPGVSFPARVDSISPEVGKNTTYPVKLAFSEEDQRIREGLDGEVTLTLPNPLGSTQSVPSTCVATLPHAEKFVWIVNSIAEKGGYATVSRRVVEIGNLREDGKMEILSGVSAGDIIVSRGVHQLEENQEVKLAVEEG